MARLYNGSGYHLDPTSRNLLNAHHRCPHDHGRRIAGDPLLALAQSAILPQQRDTAGNVMEPLGQVLIASETGPSGLYDCTRDGNWCMRVQPVAEEGDRPSVLEVLEKVQGRGKPHTYHVSIDVPQESELSLWPWIVRLALAWAAMNR